MTEIDKLKLLINAEIIENKSNYALFNEGMKKGSEIAQSIILHQNGWRKVEEELPEVQEITYQIIARESDGDCDLYYVRKGIDISFFLEGYTEWKPIE